MNGFINVTKKEYKKFTIKHCKYNSIGIIDLEWYELLPKENLYDKNKNLIAYAYFGIPNIYFVNKKLFEKAKKKGKFAITDNEFKLTNSDFYDNSIFNLVWLYKTIDFDKYELLFYEW